MAIEFIARAVAEPAVMAMLYALESSSPHVPKYGEIAMSIVKAANEDPLFPGHVAGAEATACILTALAWKESRFHANVIGDNGHSFGLYQIQPPTSKTRGELLLLPVNASIIATGLIHQSFSECKNLPWTDRLSWYIASAGCKDPHPVIRQKSRERLILAQQLFARFFPQATMPDQASPFKYSPPASALPPKG